MPRTDLAPRPHQRRAMLVGLLTLLLLSSLGAATQAASAQIEGSPIEPEPFDLYIEKWVCPPDISPNKPIETYFQVCTPSAGSFTFVLQSEAGASRKATQGGMVAWSDVPTGQVRIVERMPHEYGTTKIYCSFITKADLFIPTSPGMFDPRPYNPAGVISPNGAFATNVAGVPILYCLWFNFLDDGPQE